MARTKRDCWEHTKTVEQHAVYVRIEGKFVRLAEKASVVEPERFAQGNYGFENYSKKEGPLDADLVACWCPVCKKITWGY